MFEILTTRGLVDVIASVGIPGLARSNGDSVGSDGRIVTTEIFFDMILHIFSRRFVV